MKTIIIILTLLLSTSLFSNEQQDKTDFEAGIIFSHITSSGFLLKYNIDNKISVRGSGYLAKIDDNLYYNIKLSVSNTIHNSNYGEFYLLGGVGIFSASSNEGIPSDSYNTILYYMTAGLGYKYKLQRGMNIFFELEQNLIFANNERGALFLPIPSIGFSVDF